MRAVRDLRRTARLPQRPEGFTLVELLVVMAILASLAAILVPIVASGRRMAKVTATKQLLANTEQAIGLFSNQTGYYPPDKIPSGAPLKSFSSDAAWSGSMKNPTTHMTPAEALYYCLANPYLVRGHSPFLELQASKESADADGDGLPEIVDPWDHAFSYNRKPFPNGVTLPTIFPGVANLGGYDDGTSPTHNVDTYDLWSAGPEGYGGAEWISNWR